MLLYLPVILTKGILKHMFSKLQKNPCFQTTYSHFIFFSSFILHFHKVCLFVNPKSCLIFSRKIDIKKWQKNIIFPLGQEDIPVCFASGECANSPKQYSWEANTIYDCLLKCQEVPDCEFFSDHETGGALTIDSYSPDSCTDCNVGRRTCKSENLHYERNPSFLTWWL